VSAGLLGRIDLAHLLAQSSEPRWQLRLVVHHADGGERQAWMDVELPMPAAQTASATGGAR
jgi:hypothetical protein